MFKENVLIIVAILLYHYPSFSQGKWEQVLPPGPTTNQMASVHFMDEFTGWYS